MDFLSIKSNFGIQLKKLIKKINFNYLWIGVSITALVFVILLGIFPTINSQFSDLSQSFIHGHLNFLSPIGGANEDPVLYKGKIFWDEGPLPAVVLMPFVAIANLLHFFFYQGYIQWILVLGVVYLVYKLSIHFKYSNYDSLILSLGFTLGSVFIGVAANSSSWYFAQVITTVLLFWGLYEYFSHTKKRWYILGLICGLLFLTRTTAAGIIIFFGLEALQLQQKDTTVKRIKRIAQLFTPLVLAGLLIMVYNYLRFGSPLNAGYGFQLLKHSSAISKSLGFYSPIHIPTNLFSALLRGPSIVLRNSQSYTLKFPFFTNNIYGMSMFITSPYLLQLFTNSWSSFNKTSRRLLLTIVVIALMVFSTYFIGLSQFGYRYSLDFLPLIFVLLLINYRQNHQSLSRGMRFLLLGSGILNLYMLVPYILKG